MADKCERIAAEHQLSNSSSPHSEDVVSSSSHDDKPLPDIVSDETEHTEEEICRNTASTSGGTSEWHEDRIKSPKVVSSADTSIVDVDTEGGGTIKKQVEMEATCNSNELEGEFIEKSEESIHQNEQAMQEKRGQSFGICPDESRSINPIEQGGNNIIEPVKLSDDLEESSQSFEEHSTGLDANSFKDVPCRSVTVNQQHVIKPDTTSPGVAIATRDDDIPSSHITSTSTNITTTSPNTMSTSPHITSTSPHIMSTSPHITSTSPHITPTSTNLTSTSPLITTTSPNTMSTYPNITSPHVTSPNITSPNLMSPHPTSQLLECPKTTPSTSSTNENDDETKDFITPDYDYPATPLYSIGDDSGKEHHISIGDSSKSVTFADDLLVTEDLNDDKMTKDDGVKGHEEQQTDQVSQQENLFPTAVSEEKIEEAKQKRKDRISCEKKAGDFGLFGAPRLEERLSMDDVVGTKAKEHFDRGCILLSGNEPGRSVVCFDKAINLCPKEIRFYLMRSETYLQMCDFQSAILNLKKVCVLDPVNETYYKRLAFVYYFQGQTLFDQCLYAEALESFSRASEMRPEVIGYHTRSVACLAALQRHGECLALINKRLEVEHTNPDLYIMRARLHELFRNTSLCYYDLKDAIALDPGREEAGSLMKELQAKAEEHRNNAVRLQLQGKYKDAMNKMTAAVETNPAVPDYHLLRGALHRRLHDYNAAIDDFLLALDKTNHNEEARVYMDAQRQLLLTYNDFAVECFLGRHFEEAIILLNKAIKGEKREKGLYINRGDCFFRLNELHFALADYHQALELDNMDWGVRSRIASIHFEFGLVDFDEHNYQEAEARFTVAIQHNPRKGSYYIQRAKVRFLLENQVGAKHDLLVTLHLEPNNEDILGLLPRLYPGKPISDIMRSKAARQVKIELENAVVTASPVKLPRLSTGESVHKDEHLNEASAQTKGQASITKHVAFTSSGVTPASQSVVPDLRACMDEISFNTVLAKKKKKLSSSVKSLLHERPSLWNTAPKPGPQPPPRPYVTHGSSLNKNQSNIDTAMGWRSFSMGVTLK